MDLQFVWGIFHTIYSNRKDVSFNQSFIIMSYCSKMFMKTKNMRCPEATNVLRKIFFGKSLTSFGWWVNVGNHFMVYVGWSFDNFDSILNWFQTYPNNSAVCKEVHVFRNNNWGQLGSNSGNKMSDRKV